MNKNQDKIPFKGRGTQFNSKNKFDRYHYTEAEIEIRDEPLHEDSKTKYIKIFPKKIVNKNTSLDIPFSYSMNPYQGCEHGCIYCYARNSHNYWGYSAGLDFERVILFKENAPELLDKELSNKNWKASPIMLSGNTDCYQPLERIKGITRRILKILIKHKHPVSIITKNTLIQRDMDLLKELATVNLVTVNFSITTLDDKLRRVLEPRTASAKKKLDAITLLSQNNIPVTVMMAPIIPSLNDYEIPSLLKRVSEAGAQRAGYTIIRLNEALGDLFTDWVHTYFPDRAEKILNQIKEIHGGALNASAFGSRMRGQGRFSEHIKQLFYLSHRKYFSNDDNFTFNLDLFAKQKKPQLDLFD